MEDLKLQLIENRKQSNDCFLLRLKGSVKQMKPGQFLNVAIPNYSLRRPISLCDLDEDIITLLIRINGEGTKYLSQLKEGSELKALLPLGNGLDLDNFEDEILLIGGGVGVAPLLYTAKKAHEKGLKVITILGFRTRQDALLLDEFKKYSDELYLSYDEDRENVVTKILEKDLVNIKFICCGPTIMMKNVSLNTKADGYFSLEARMGCGFGACMGCSFKTINGNRRICKEGPIFKKEEIIWDSLM